MKNKKAQAAAIAAGAVCAAFLTYKAVDEAATRILVSNALDRKAPRVLTLLKNAIKGKKTPDPVDRRIAEESVRLAALDLETVSIEAADGTPLVGKYRPAPDAKRLIVAMHGWRSNWTRDFGALADFWYESGCSVLYPDQRGQGKSGGDYICFGTRECSDCALWAKYLAGREGTKLPMYLAGVSMGATTVLMASALDLPENVRGIIADCGLTSAKDIWKHVCENNLHVRYKGREKRVNALCLRRIGCTADDLSTLDAVSDTSIPILFIHGESDTFVPIEMTMANIEACRSPKRLLTVPGASHARSSWNEPEMYRNALVEFWNEYDGAK